MLHKSKIKAYYGPKILDSAHTYKQVVINSIIPQAPAASHLSQNPIQVNPTCQKLSVCFLKVGIRKISQDTLHLLIKDSLKREKILTGA